MQKTLQGLDSELSGLMLSVNSVQKKGDFEHFRRGMLSVPSSWEIWDTFVDLRALLTTFRDWSESDDCQMLFERHVADVMADDAPDPRTGKSMHFRNLGEEQYHEKCLP